MFDQSFSAKNFRKIFDYENRKGIFLEGRFFPELEHITADIKACIGRIRDLRRNKHEEIANGTYEENKTRLYKQRFELKQSKDKRLMDLLEQASAEVAKQSFELGIEEGPIANGKRVYTSGATAASYFSLKQLQRNLRRLYKIKQSNRYQIVCQLRELLSDSFPKYVVRLDLAGFYENIPRPPLLKKLANDPLLTVASKQLITHLLWEYGNKYNAPRGLPRGIGISAYLSELFMRSFDDSIRGIPGVVYYARYVDDIVVVFVPSPNRRLSELMWPLKAHLKEHSLKLNRIKSTLIQVDGRTTHTVDFLGYSFAFGNGDIALSMTASKLAKYKTRVQLSFDAFTTAPPPAKIAARRLLIKRIRFLTGNTRLLNNKKNALVGIYFSNNLITSERDLRALDGHLRSMVAAQTDPHLVNKLAVMSFERGFITKRFHRYSVQDLASIVKVWKYAT